MIYSRIASLVINNQNDTSLLGLWCSINNQIKTSLKRTDEKNHITEKKIVFPKWT